MFQSFKAFRIGRVFRTVAETWRRILGERTNFSRPKISEWRFFREKFPFSG